MISLLSIIAMGFLFGMRHATDPDHVIAVSTIVSREGNIKRASLIGVAWGTERRIATVGKHFASLAGLVSVALGLFIACQIGSVDGLFHAQAHWIPR